MPKPALWAAIALAALFLAYCLRGASPTGDDFVYLALGRHLGNPLPLLVQDPLGAYFFRPLVMLLWWLTSDLPGGDATQYAIGIALHAANALLLAALARELGLARGPAALGAIAFLVHPTAF